MLQTPLCTLLGIEFPIIQAGMGVFTSAELAQRCQTLVGWVVWGPSPSLSRTCPSNWPYAGMDQSALRRQSPWCPRSTRAPSPTLGRQASVIAFALGDPGDLVQRAHDVGSLVIHQVTTVPASPRSRRAGRRRHHRPGGEAGGYGGTIATFTLLPQVVDAVSPLPVVAAGGIADGRGLAAALVLGAAGVNVGTRFLASVEAPIPLGWKQPDCRSRGAGRSQSGGLERYQSHPWEPGYGTVIRALRTPFIDTWQHRRDDARREADRLRGEVLAALQHGRIHELLPFAGESAGWCMTSSRPGRSCSVWWQRPGTPWSAHRRS